jgi:hypothetical protein
MQKVIVRTQVGAGGGLGRGNNYIFSNNNTTRFRLNLDNPNDIITNWSISTTQGYSYDEYPIAAYNEYVYLVQKITGNVSRLTSDASRNTFLPAWGTRPNAITNTYTGRYMNVYNGNLYIAYASTTNCYFVRMLLSNPSGVNTEILPPTSSIINSSCAGFTVYEDYIYYFPNTAQRNGIWRVNMQNGSITEVVSAGNFAMPNIVWGMSVQNNILYAALGRAGIDTGTIGAVNLNNLSEYNDNLESLADPLSLNNPSGITIYNNQIYGTQLGVQSVYKANLTWVPTSPTKYTTIDPLYAQYGGSFTLVNSLYISITDRGFNSGISYYYYLYNGSGTNQSSNNAAYTYLAPLGNTTIVTTKTITGISKGTYFVYLQAVNSLGRSTAISSNPITYTTVNGTSNMDVTVWNGNLYVAVTDGTIRRISLDDPTNISNNWATGSSGNYGIAAYRGNIYTIGINNNIIKRISVANPSTNFANTYVNWSGNSSLSGVLAYSMSVYGNYLYVGHNNSRISRVNLDSISDNTIYWLNASSQIGNANAFIGSMVGYNSDLYFAAAGGIYKYSNVNALGGNISSVISVADSIYGMEVQDPYLFYSTFGNPSNIRYINLTNYADKGNHATPVSTTQNTGIVKYNNILYSVSNNSTIITSTNLPVIIDDETVPNTSIANSPPIQSFNSTKTTFDITFYLKETTNTALNNNVYYYWYSLDYGATYTNTGVQRTGSAGEPYAVTISNVPYYTQQIYIIGRNSKGDSSPYTYTISKKVLFYTSPETTSTNYGLAVGNGNLYTAKNATNNAPRSRINLTTGAIESNWARNAGNSYYGLSIATDNTYVYLVNSNNVGNGNITRISVNTPNSYTDWATSIRPTGVTGIFSAGQSIVNDGNLYTVFYNSTSAFFNRILLSNSTVKSAIPVNATIPYSISTFGIYGNTIYYAANNAQNVGTVYQLNINTSISTSFYTTSGASIKGLCINYPFIYMTLVRTASNSDTIGVLDVTTQPVKYNGQLITNVSVPGTIAASSSTIYWVEEGSKGNIYSAPVTWAPSVPDLVSVSSAGSGNICIEITDNINTYFNKDTKYYYYLYDGVGLNQYADISNYNAEFSSLPYTSNTTVGYINNVYRNTYMVYIAVKNIFGDKIFIHTHTIENIGVSGNTVISGIIRNFYYSDNYLYFTRIASTTRFISRYNLDTKEFANVWVLASSGTTLYTALNASHSLYSYKGNLYISSSTAITRINISNTNDMSNNWLVYASLYTSSGINTVGMSIFQYPSYGYGSYIYIFGRTVDTADGTIARRFISRISLDNPSQSNMVWFDVNSSTHSTLFDSQVGAFAIYNNMAYYTTNSSPKMTFKFDINDLNNANSKANTRIISYYIDVNKSPYIFVPFNNIAFYGMADTNYSQINYFNIIHSPPVTENGVSQTSAPLNLNTYTSPDKITNFSYYTQYTFKYNNQIGFCNLPYSGAVSIANITLITMPIVDVLVTPQSFSFTGNCITIGNINLSITDNNNDIYNSVYYYYYLYVPGTTDQSSNISVYTDTGIFKNISGNTYTYQISNVSANKYTIYMVAKNSVGYTSPIAASVSVYTSPVAPTIVSAISTLAGNLTISLFDNLNSATNDVYYFYSTNGTPYGNSGILKTSDNAYSFTIKDTGDASISLTDISYTIFVRSQNKLSVSSSVSQSAIVYQTPNTPSVISVTSTQSGNVDVTVTETNPLAYYYLNNVYYYYYLYKSTGQNQSGNNLVYSNSYAMFTSASNTTQFKIQGQSANNYTLYITSRNAFGNSSPTLGNAVNIRTTPVSFNSYRVTCKTSGNINIDITDNVNDVNNAVGYYYYVYDSGINNFNVISAYTDTGLVRNGNTTTYLYTIPGFINKQYTVYLIAKNSIGYTTPVSSNVIVYTTPISPTIVSANSTSAGNLTISLFDNLNSATNDVYYLYSTNGTTYGNSGVLKTSGNTYPITITDTGDASIYLTDISYTVFIKSTNSVGNSSAVSQSAIVYQTPNTPSVISVTSTQSGNVDVTVTETNPLAYYYLNNVYYYYYLYNGVGQNQFGNNLAYSNSYAMFTSASNTTQFKIQGQPANNYTLYITAKNSISISSPTLGNAVTIRTTPVNFTFYTVTGTSVGNINITITDNANDVNNAVGYYYYVYDSDSGTNNSGNIFAYTDTRLIRDNDSTTTYSRIIPGFTNKKYTVYLVAKNNVGNTDPVSSSVTVLITPLTPSILSTNSYSYYTPGTLFIDISDNVNLLMNGVYYYYSMDGITYGNSGVAKTADTTYTFTINDTGNASILLTKTRYPTLYVRAQNTAAASPPATIGPVEVYQIICFNHDTQIFTNKGYRKIQELKKGDLVKTYKHGFKKIYLIGKKEFTHRPTLQRLKDHLYRCSKSQYPELLEDLIITGCHSVLVDDYVDEAQYNRVIEVNGDAYITDDKYRLPVCADERASIYEKPGKYTVYHIALENERYCGNYGIYANGLLVESTSKRFLEETDIMNTY